MIVVEPREHEPERTTVPPPFTAFWIALASDDEELVQLTVALNALWAAGKRERKRERRRITPVLTRLRLLLRKPCNEESRDFRNRYVTLPELFRFGNVNLER